MESAVIIKAANFNGIPCVVLRIVSDGLKDSATKYQANEEDIAFFGARILYDVLNDIDLRGLKID